MLSATQPVSVLKKFPSGFFAILATAGALVFSTSSVSAGPSPAAAPKAEQPAAVASGAKPSATPSPSTELTPAQRQFAAAFVSAVNAKNSDALRQLIVPEALKCQTVGGKDKEAAKAFLDRWLTTRMRYTITSNYEVRIVPYPGALRGSRLFLPAAQPTHVLTFKFSPEPGKDVFLPEYVRQENGKVYLIAPCATGRGIEHFREGRERREESLGKAREIYAKLQDPLRSRLTALIKQKQQVQALTLCMRELNLDQQTAKYVVELLAGREPGAGPEGWRRPNAMSTGTPK